MRGHSIRTIGRGLAIIVCTTAMLRAQTTASSHTAPESASISVGIGSVTVYTSWYYYRVLDSFGTVVQSYYPYHRHSRTAVVFSYSTRPLFSFAGVSAALRGEGIVGIGGGSTEDWLPDGESISDGGSTVGAAAHLLFSCPLPVLPGVRTRFFAGTGFQATALTANGEGVGNRYAGSSAFRYANGWTETVVGVPLILGTSVRFGDLVAAVEYRMLIGGTAMSDWEPVGVEIEEEEGPDVDVVLFSVGIVL